MRYSILGFNQRRAIEAKLDMSDLMLLDYIITANGNPAMKHVVKAGVSYVWLSHDKIREDLPILNIAEGTLRNKLSILKKNGWIISVTDKLVRGAKTYYSVTLNTMSLRNDTMMSRENDIRCHSEMTSDNQLDNNQLEDNKTISNEIVADAPTESSHRKSLVTPKTSPLVKPKKNLYDSCIEAIEEFTEDEEIRDKLKEYLSVRLERKDKPFGIKTFQSTLKKLRTLTDKKTEALQIIQYSIDGQYGTFYELKKNNGYKRQPRGAEISGEYGIVKTGGDMEEKIINVQF